MILFQKLFFFSPEAYKSAKQQHQHTEQVLNKCLTHGTEQLSSVSQEKLHSHYYIMLKKGSAKETPSKEKAAKCDTPSISALWLQAAQQS